MTNLLIRGVQGRFPVFLSGVIILAGIIASFGATEDGSTKKSLEYITQEEMNALVEKIEKGFPGKPLTREPTYSSAQEKAQSYRGHWAFVASKRVDPRYRLVPPKLPEAEDRGLAKWVAAVESNADSPLPCAVDTKSIYQIQSEALDQLFPEWTFLDVPSVVHTVHPPPPRDSGGFSYPFWGILAVRKATVHAFSGNCISNPPFGYKTTTDFPSFARAEGVRIRNVEDASRLWDAYCSFCRYPWRSGKHVQVKRRLWRLNDNPKEAGERVLEVRTGADGRVESMELIEPNRDKLTKEEK